MLRAIRNTLWVLATLLFLPAAAHAQTTNISAGASVATINSAIAAAEAAPGNPIIQFAAGNYSINGTVTVGCPTMASSITIQGPASTYRAPANLLPGSYSYSTPYTANLNSSITNNFAWFIGSNGCIKPITIQYFNWNGGQPSGGGGGWMQVAGGESNLTVQYNYIHGNWASVATAHDYDDSILLVGSGSPSQLPINNNIHILWNVFGDGVSDCNPIMNLTRYQNGSDPRNYDFYGGYCGGIGIRASTTGMVIQNNDFEHLEQPAKYFQGVAQSGNYAQTYMLNQFVFSFNDVGQWHRIGLENQNAVVNAPSGGPNATGGVADHNSNSFHDPIDPQYGTFGLSLPMCCTNFFGYTTTDNQSNCNSNTMVDNVLSPSFTSYAFEWWSTGHCDNNLMVGHWNENNGSPSSSNAGGIGWGNTNTSVRFWSASNNIAQFLYTNGQAVIREPEQTNIPPTQTNNVTTYSFVPRTSFAPTISPPAGAKSFPFTVTLTDTGYTSGGGPLGNTGIWYTTDGSTPVPGSGTAKRLDDGGTFTLPAAATVKAVGMWGAANQPAFYPSNFGWVPSSVVTSTFTGSGLFISPTGNDANSGTSSSPWLTPNHAMTCGQVITALPGTYSAANFQNGNWGTVTCAGGNNVAWLQCQTFDTCKITAAASDGMWVDKSFWGVQGWEITTNTTQTGACFHAGPSSNVVIHHIIFANNVANGCMGGGFTAYSQNGTSTTASVDYIAYLGNVAYNSAQGNGACYSGLNIYQPIASDTASGTHMYIAGNFAYNNVDASPCASGQTTDGEGINFDTFDYSQHGGTAYVQQAVAQNNISVSNGGRGIYAENNKTGSAAATIFFKNNTAYGNNKQGTQTFCTGNGDIEFQAAFNGTASNNISMTDTANGCTGVAKYSFAVANGNNTVSVAGNWLYSSAGNTTFSFNNGSFAYGSNVLGTNPAFASTTVPGAPSCSGKTNVPDCMATLITNFTPTAGGSTALGYQTPSSTSITDTLFPQWLCAGTGTLNPNIPSGLITPGCGGGASPTLTGGHQDNAGSINTLAVGAAAWRQLAVGSYSDGSSHNLPDSFGNTAVWGSSNPSVLNVSGTGQISCLAGGTANSTVTASPGGQIFSPWGWTCNSVPAATPTFTPGSQSFTGTVSVTISTTTAGATINYTTDGSTPTTSSPTYTGPITISATTTVRAIANASGFTQSAVGSATYTLLVPAATPTFNPVSGTIFGSSLSVSIADSTAGASIFYTTDGSTPTTSSTLYTGAFTITTSTTVKAIATASGFTQSAVGTASYTASTNVIVAVNLAVLGNQNYVLVGGTAQFAAVFTYADSTQTTNTTVGVDDTRGNHITAWNLTSRGGTGAISSSGMFTGITLGSVQVNSTETGAIPGSTPWFEYVSQSITNRASGVTMDGVTIP